MTINIFHRNRKDKEIIRLLKQVLEKVNEKEELEKQMDGWLVKLRQGFAKLKEVSDRVDSTK